MLLTLTLKLKTNKQRLYPLLYPQILRFTDPHHFLCSAILRQTNENYCNSFQA
jgi:hypothetical protein